MDQSYTVIRSYLHSRHGRTSGRESGMRPDANQDQKRVGANSSFVKVPCSASLDQTWSPKTILKIGTCANGNKLDGSKLQEPKFSNWSTLNTFNVIPTKTTMALSLLDLTMILMCLNKLMYRKQSSQGKRKRDSETIACNMQDCCTNADITRLT